MKPSQVIPFVGVWLAVVSTAMAAETLPQTFLVPNFHPASCGWLTNWSTERNYCANSYLNHLDRVRDDPSYAFVISEVNNLIAIRNFCPERFEELKSRVAEGRVEAVNAFFLEPTINLSGGEALAKMGIEGIRWQKEMLGVSPRYCWAIDVCGVHEQMPQIAVQLGLDGLVYTRCNPTNQTLHWSVSPDGSKILTMIPGHYSDEAKDVFGSKQPLSAEQLENLRKEIESKVKVPDGGNLRGSDPVSGQSKQALTPPGAPILLLGGAGDYALAPVRKEFPSEFLKQWKEFLPGHALQFSTLSRYVDAFLPAVKSGAIPLEESAGGTDYAWDAFWIQCPKIKSWFRRNEQALHAAEAAATIASLQAGSPYPAVDFQRSWLQMLLNMDRNTLWGAAGGMVFEHPESWDAKDRSEWVENQTHKALQQSLTQLAGDGNQECWFNPLNWRRSDVPSLPSCGLGVAPQVESLQEIPLPKEIETPFYTAQIDAKTGALISLKSKPSGREMLGGAANVLVLEKNTTNMPGDFCLPRCKRPRLADSNGGTVSVRVQTSATNVVVTVHGDFLQSERVMRFSKIHPRIEFSTEVTDVPDRGVLVAEFPLVGTPGEVRRGIPFGFSKTDGRPHGIVPVVRWNDYASPGQGGLAFLDRGLTGREWADGKVAVFLYNATEKYWGYPNPWLSGKGRHRFEYALYPHESDWAEAHVPQQAWEFNSPPVSVRAGNQAVGESFLETSDNCLVEALRRDGPDIEIRLVEALGIAGEGQITVRLPHRMAVQTDLIGGKVRPLAGGPTYHVSFKPQEIVTIRLRTATPVEIPAALTSWEEMVPIHKRAALLRYQPDKMGHPPRGD